MKTHTKYDFDLDLESSPKVKIFEISIKETYPKYAWVLCTGHHLLLARSKVKVKVEQKVNSLN